MKIPLKLDSIIFRDAASVPLRTLEIIWIGLSQIVCVIGETPVRLFYKNMGESFGVQKPYSVILSVAKNLLEISNFTDREQPKSLPNGLWGIFGCGPHHFLKCTLKVGRVIER